MERNIFEKMVGEQFPTASHNEQNELFELFETKKEVFDNMLKTFLEAESADTDIMASRIYYEYSKWINTKDFFAFPIFWQTMLEVLLIKSSIIADGRDIRAYYQSITDIYVGILIEKFGKEAIYNEVKYFYAH